MTDTIIFSFRLASGDFQSELKIPVPRTKAEQKKAVKGWLDLMATAFRVGADHISANLELEPLPSLTDKVMERIAAERLRQIEEEGWTIEHDDQFPPGTLARAGASYALMGGETDRFRKTHGVDHPPSFWPWPGRAWNPNDRKRDLERAAALVVSELEKIERAEEAARSPAPGAKAGQQ